MDHLDGNVISRILVNRQAVRVVKFVPSTDRSIGLAGHAAMSIGLLRHPCNDLHTTTPRYSKHHLGVAIGFREVSVAVFAHGQRRVLFAFRAVAAGGVGLTPWIFGDEAVNHQADAGCRPPVSIKRLLLEFTYGVAKSDVVISEMLAKLFAYILNALKIKRRKSLRCVVMVLSHGLHAVTVIRQAVVDGWRNNGVQNVFCILDTTAALLTYTLLALKQESDGQSATEGDLDDPELFGAAVASSLARNTYVDRQVLFRLQEGLAVDMRKALENLLREDSAVLAQPVRDVVDINRPDAVLYGDLFMGMLEPAVAGVGNGRPGWRLLLSVHEINRCKVHCVQLEHLSQEDGQPVEFMCMMLDANVRIQWREWRDGYTYEHLQLQVFFKTRYAVGHTTLFFASNEANKYGAFMGEYEARRTEMLRVFPSGTYAKRFLSLKRPAHTRIWLSFPARKKPRHTMKIRRIIGHFPGSSPYIAALIGVW
ncbi:uncharacterized protein LOC129602156 [Paramacrobiotus metropolitanus]|uniref:uncharacterized protein LOC129602156 n=1 Tax=Paramacrobiotus metropolitanus TaxID=2943436 RepID=UPI002445F335|nr:uncharacterized protein LOC129602156 [Paramacrobiotus metropolitanus]